jgi:hypothetical protein
MIFAYLRAEGCAVHPDDTDADLSDDQYFKQLRAYYINYGSVVFNTPCSRPDQLAALLLYVKG